MTPQEAFSGSWFGRSPIDQSPRAGVRMAGVGQTGCTLKPMNPYTPPSSDIVNPKDVNPFVLGLNRAIVAAIVSSAVCMVLAFVAKAIDSAIPGEGALHDATIIGILRNAALVFTLMVMISFFATFAYYAGEKRLNAGFCVIVIFLSGLLAAWILSWMGFESPRRLHMKHPPPYLSKLLAYLIPYAVASGLMTLFCKSRPLQNTRPNDPMDRSGGSATT